MLIGRKSLFLHKPLVVILLLWMVLTGFNLTKAYHIDDSFHLEAAAWIEDHPMQPMSGLVNWKDDPTPFYTHNQPPLFFYTLALVSSLVGNSELFLHLYLSVFTLLALFCFYRLTVLLNVKRNVYLLLLFGLSPALVVNQNLMTDVPVLAILLASACFIIQADKSNPSRNYFLASLILGLGMLIKYSILPVVVVLLLIILLRKHYRHIGFVVIPLAMLALWSVWNLSEFGSIHFLDRPKGEIHINRFWSFMACMGSVAIFSMPFIKGIFSKLSGKMVASIYILIMLLPVPVFLLNLLSSRGFDLLLNYLFIANGFVIYGAVFYLFIPRLKKDFAAFIQTSEFVVLLYIGALSLFILLFAPFMATRHILLILPFILLFGAVLFDRVPKWVNNLTLAISISLAVALGISDYVYADFYRKMTAEVNLPKITTTWSRGHWGWQWYSKKAGMEFYSTQNSRVKKGDLMVFPGNIPLQALRDDIELTLLRKEWKTPGCYTFFSVSDEGSLYSNNMKIPPWTFSLQPIDTIYIYRVSGIKSEGY